MPALTPPPSPSSPRKSLARRLARCVLGVSALLGAAAGSGAARDGGEIAILYPDVVEPYRSVFSQIILGIEDRLSVPVHAISLAGDISAQDIAKNLRQENVRLVIALGRHGLSAANALDPEFSVIAGGVVSAPPPDRAARVIFSLAPEPALLFARLRILQPKVKRVFAVYDPAQSDWMMHLAQAAATTAGLELRAFEASDLKSAMFRYQAILAEADGRNDAIWLPQDPTTVEDSIVLPMLLQESWNRSIPLFSSNVAHVKRGALFSLYPNNRELGHRIGAQAASRSPGAHGDGMVALQDVLQAVNTRTAAHLGIAFSEQQLRNYDLVYPQQ